MFGTQLVYGNPATSLATDGNLHVVGLQDGTAVTSRAVIISTGVSYRRLAVPELESLAGAGVFYGAAMAEAQAVAGKRTFVVGVGNSAASCRSISRYEIPRRRPPDPPDGLVPDRTGSYPAMMRSATRPGWSTWT